MIDNFAQLNWIALHIWGMQHEVFIRIIWLRAYKAKTPAARATNYSFCKAQAALIDLIRKEPVMKPGTIF